MDKLRRNVVHTAASLSQSSKRIRLALASIFASTCEPLTSVKQTRSDVSIFFKRAGFRLLCLSANCVDDLLRAAPLELSADLDTCLRKLFQCNES